MKKLLFFFLFIPHLLYSQITKTNIAQSRNFTLTNEFDSLKSYLGKGYGGYIGQTLYLNEKIEPIREYGFSGFFLDYTKDQSKKSNTYKPLGGYHPRKDKFDLGGGRSDYDQLVGKYFEVIDAIKTNYVFLKLVDKETSDTIYYKYDERYAIDFPFIVVGHFEKLKNRDIGRSFVIKGKNWLTGDGPMFEITTGNPVSHFNAFSEWEIVDVTIENKRYELSYILENEIGEKISLPVDRATYRNVFFFDEMSDYLRDFGEENLSAIFKEKVKIGMTKKMCELAWGKPDKVNKTTMSGSVSEQWVYPENYLYFDNGKLTAIQ